MVLDGMVPVLTQTPPTTARDSMTATRFFILEAATAARCPEGPEPMTTRSYLAALIYKSPGTARRNRCRAEVYQPSHEEGAVCGALISGIPNLLFEGRVNIETHGGQWCLEH